MLYTKSHFYLLAIIMDNGYLQLNIIVCDIYEIKLFLTSNKQIFKIFFTYLY